ncbi:MAG: hypothetical protein HZB46_08210, partial [Solirubrobacterales bacterium]|nr:hypothetical protein [Solirubrobacterales bacterium]
GTPFVLAVGPGVPAHEAVDVERGLRALQDFARADVGHAIESDTQVRLARDERCSAAGPSALGAAQDHRVCLLAGRPGWSQAPPAGRSWVAAHEAGHVLQAELGCLPEPRGQHYAWVVEGMAEAFAAHALRRAGLAGAPPSDVPVDDAGLDDAEDGRLDAGTYRAAFARLEQAAGSDVGRMRRFYEGMRRPYASWKATFRWAFGTRTAVAAVTDLLAGAGVPAGELPSGVWLLRGRRCGGITRGAHSADVVTAERVCLFPEGEGWRHTRYDELVLAAGGVATATLERIGCNAAADAPVYRWLVAGSAQALAWLALERAGALTHAEVNARIDLAEDGRTVRIADGVARAPAWQLGAAAGGLAQRRPEPLLRFCRSVAAGARWRTAFERDFGMTPRRFYAAIEAVRQQAIADAAPRRRP